MKRLLTKIGQWIDNNSGKPLFTSVSVLLIAIAVILLIDLFVSYDSLPNFWQGLMVEGHGMFFDVIVVILIYNWIDNRRQKKLRIERYKEELEDYRRWPSDEAMYRMMGLIRRLNNEGVTELDLRGAHLVGAHLEGAYLRWANLWEAHLEEVNLEGANLWGAKIELFQLKRAHLLEEETTMMDGTKYDDSWVKRIKESQEPEKKSE